MTSMELLELLGSVKDQYILEARDESDAKRIPCRKAALIAAVIALTLLLVGCAVVYVLSMQEIKLGEQTVTYDVYDTNLQ